MLYGEYQHNMDAKGRVTVPSKFRDDIGDIFYVCKGVDTCLFIYSLEQWAILENEISAMPMGQARLLQRHFFASATRVEADKQGRILISQSLREYAGIKKEVVILGIGTRGEIWDNQNWKKYNEVDNSEDIIKALEELNI